MAFLSANAQTNNRQSGTTEVSLIIPYSYSETIDFEGGASADIDGDHGFGIGFAYNIKHNLATKVDFVWHSRNYAATRVLDDGDNTTERYAGRLDDFNLRIGADYYLTSGRIAPFINGNAGWTFVDSNIPSGPPSSVCWWDPWLGYICSSSVPTHTDSSWFYGAGLGLRIDLGRSNFAKITYLETWVDDLNHTTDLPGFSSVRFEFGFSY